MQLGYLVQPSFWLPRLPWCRLTEVMLLYVHLFLYVLLMCLLAMREWGTTHVWPLGSLHVHVWSTVYLYMYNVLYTVFVQVCIVRCHCMS